MFRKASAPDEILSDANSDTAESISDATPGISSPLSTDVSSDLTAPGSSTCDVPATGAPVASDDECIILDIPVKVQQRSLAKRQGQTSKSRKVNRCDSI